jgi:Tfp pilus assembly PilM family ATPase
MPVAKTLGAINDLKGAAAVEAARGVQSLKRVDLAAAAAAMKGKRLQTRTRTPIGIDVGSRVVKAVQFGRDRWGGGKWQVVAATQIPRSEVAQGGPSGPSPAGAGGPASAQVAAQALGQSKPLTADEVRRLAGTLERQGFAGSDVVLAVPTDKLSTSVLDLPPRASQAPLEQITRMELARAHKVAPDSFEMGCWDLPAAARATKATPVMAVACTHADANAIIDPFEAEGFKARALDVRPAAIARACDALVGNPNTLTAILDVGWTAAALSLMHQGVVIYGRTLGDGGISKLYQTLANRLGLEDDVIDYLLGETGLGDAGPAGAAAARRGPVDAGGLIAAHFEAAVEELKVSLTYAQHQYHETAVSRLLLVGGGACIPGVAAHLSKTLGVETRTAAPADTAASAPAVAGVCASPALMLAMGLAQHPEGPWR